jgi:hypothetical protein
MEAVFRFNRSTLKNDRLSSLGLVHIHRDFEVDLYKAMEVFVSYQTRREDFGQFDYEFETRLLKSENRFHTQHLLPRALTATIYEAYQADVSAGRLVLVVCLPPRLDILSDISKVR